MQRQSYFSLFDLEPCFTLSPDELDLAYRTLASRVHPDRYACADAAEQRRALMLATDANEAYRTLRQPVLRARHLLNLRGIADPERYGGASPQAFLLEQIAWRETLGDAKAARDEAALGRLLAQVRTRAGELQAQLGLHLDREKDDAAAARTLQQLMFVEKLMADIDDAHAVLEA